MKLSKLSLAGILLTAAASGSAWAHTSFGVSIGIPLGGPVYYPPYYPPPYYSPYYYYPPAVAAAPPVYVQQGPAPQMAAGAYWNYCRRPAGYYPYVRQCPGGWERVPAQPPR